MFFGEQNARVLYKSCTKYRRGEGLRIASKEQSLLDERLDVLPCRCQAGIQLIDGCLQGENLQLVCTGRGLCDLLQLDNGISGVGRSLLGFLHGLDVGIVVQIHAIIRLLLGGPLLCLDTSRGLLLDNPPLLDRLDPVAFAGAGLAPVVFDFGGTDAAFGAEGAEGAEAGSTL